MLPLLWVLALPMMLLAALLAGGLWMNNLPWDDPPGMGIRLQTYLESHVAETAEGSPFPELRPRHYPNVSPDQLFAHVERAVAGMPDWTIAARDAKRRRVEAVVSTPLLRFQDDVTINVTAEANGNGAVLFLRSQSRIGQGDLGANTRHILDVVAQVESFLAEGGKPSTAAAEHR